jgi:glycosyltransferase involved in cell wall biosynthesis
MRVAVFTDNDFDKVNGVTTALTAVIRRAPADVSPRIYTASTLGVDQPDYLALATAGVPIPFYREMKVYWPSWRELGRRIEADRMELLHLTTPGPLGLAALWVARRTGLPMVGSFHTDLEAYTATLSGSPQLARCMGMYLRWIYEHCRTILVPSEATRTMLIGRGLDGTRLEVWPRGVDTDLFTPARRSSALREQWRVTDQRPALLYVGRISREKGLRRLPALSDALSRSGLAHRLVFAGDGPLRRELAEACPDAAFLGFLGREEVAAAFASADVLLFPSETDTAGNVVLEAQAAGLQVVVSEQGGPRENLERNATGFVCDDPGSWLMATGLLLRDPARRRTMGRAARGYAMGRRWDAALRPLFDTYRKLKNEN